MDGGSSNRGLDGDDGRMGGATGPQHQHHDEHHGGHDGGSGRGLGLGRQGGGGAGMEHGAMGTMGRQGGLGPLGGGGGLGGLGGALPGPLSSLSSLGSMNSLSSSPQQRHSHMRSERSAHSGLGTWETEINTCTRVYGFSSGLLGEYTTHLHLSADTLTYTSYLMWIPPYDTPMIHL
jgi:hypothetical protein